MSLSIRAGEFSQPYVQHIAVACDTQRGWVTVSGQRALELPFPVVELALLSAEGYLLASTIIVDAPPEFQMTLHPRGVVPEMPLILRVELLVGEESLYVAEYSFSFVS
jgi:hypothetical protein